MTKLLRVGLVALFGLAMATPAALAGKAATATYHGKMTVEDKAGVFSPEGIRAAESLFDGVTFKAKTHLTVVTLGSAPADKKQELDATKGDTAKASRFFGQWAKELADQRGEKGVFVLVYSEGNKFFVKARGDEQTDVFRSFNDKDATAVEQKLVAAFRDAKAKAGDEAKHARDAGLKEAAKVVIEELKDTTVPTGHTATTNTDGGTRETTKSGGMSWVWWVVIVIGVLLVIWIIVALIRATTGNVYGGMYGGYGGGYGYGGGGPGFFGMFMGGMLGSMAGMWMYNSLMGTHYAHDPSAAAGDYGADGGGGADADAGAGNFDNGSEGAGDGDWGADDAGAGDAGGGDWGGDAGGGGDWGGDGGGGDWGGDAGGGGDFGGGGGDW